jgi:predicted transcriptional regulator
MQPQIHELNRIRLKENLSYKEIGDKCGIPEPTMRRILQAADPKVYDRTLFKIQGYLDRRRKLRRRQRQRAASEQRVA